jgi:predicted phosphodiesterase
MILMFGDVHGNFKHVLPTVKVQRPAAIIFLGDLELCRPLEQELKEVMQLTEVYFIHGNHDTDTQQNHDCLFNSALSEKNLHGRVLEIDGMRVAGLGGIFREKIWYPQIDLDAASNYDNYESCLSNGLEANRLKKQTKSHHLTQDQLDVFSQKLTGQALTHKSSIFYEDWLNLTDQRADILITHEAPTCHPHGFKAIDVLAQNMQVKTSFHGHHHDRLDYSSHYESLGFRAHGVGLRGVSNHHGELVLAGEYDEKPSKKLRV